jgi:DinB superfamily
VLNLMQGLSSDQLLYRPEARSWSVAENVEHLVITERRLMTAIEKLLQGPPDLTTQCSTLDDELLRKVAIPVERAQAPPFAVPTLQWPAESLPQEFAAARARTRDFAGTTTADLRRYFIRHFVFGDLDGYQWLLFISGHAQRHSLQAEAVKASPGFPVQPITSP